MRALEVHDFARIWNLADMRRRLGFATAHGLNALVLHEPGIVDKVVYPSRYLGGDGDGDNLFALGQGIEEAISRQATREFLNPFRFKYLVHLIAEAAAAGVAVYLEDKEIWFKDFVVRAHPEAVQNGVFCPSQPFWWEEFLPAKYRELFVALPGLAGVITSMGTGESRLPVGNLRECGCERCRAMTPARWYRLMARGMHRPFAAAGKKLVIRDFVFQRDEQNDLASSLDEVPADVAISLKNTPHDFYPTFPDNPLIGHVGTREQWIEYDVHGQYFGWGVAPAAMLSDLRDRLHHAAGQGVTGVIFRTDWEGLQSHSCFDTLNLVNLYGGAALAAQLTTPAAEIYRRWVAGEELSADPTPAGVDRTARWLGGLLERTWPVVRGAMYVNGAVFSDSSCFHVDAGQGEWIAEVLHSLKDWSADAAGALEMSPGNARRILEEKDEAAAAALALLAEARQVNGGLTAAAYAGLLQSLEFLCRYTEGFRLAKRVFVHSRLRGAAADLQRSIAELRAFRDRLRGDPFRRVYPANALLDPQRLDCFLRDAERRASTAAPR